jgi:hypothetical protein
MDGGDRLIPWDYDVADFHDTYTGNERLLKEQHHKHVAGRENMVPLT